MPVCFSIEEIQYGEGSEANPENTHAIVMWPGTVSGSRSTGEGEPIVVASKGICEHVVTRMFTQAALEHPIVLADLIMEVLDPECADPDNVAEVCSADTEKQTIN